ncbi:MAG: phosphodiester glycosidase family protein [Lachnospira sp.]
MSKQMQKSVDYEEIELVEISGEHNKDMVMKELLSDDDIDGNHRSFFVDDEKSGKKNRSKNNEGGDKKNSKKTIKNKTKLTKGQIIGRIAASIGTVLALILVFLLGVIHVLEFGPSVTARNLFVNSVMESSAGGFMATWFFSDEEIEEMRNINSIEAVDEVTDTSLITINKDNDSKDDDDGTGIQIIDIREKSYQGKLMMVKDPSRVSVGVCKSTFDGSAGKTVAKIAEEYNAIGAINGGGFLDENGVGNGGTPIGIVVSDGELKYGNPDTTYEVIGFDNNNILHVGKMTAKEAMNKGIRDAVSFGPVLIVNGEAAIVNGNGSGIGPRTAIGQTADGTVLLLTLDGRQINSIGASYGDIIDVMLKYGAVNAANLDGGTSTVMYYNGSYINSPSAIYGSRDIPTTFIVR